MENANSDISSQQTSTKLAKKNALAHAEICRSLFGEGLSASPALSVCVPNRRRDSEFDVRRPSFVLRRDDTHRRLRDASLAFSAWSTHTRTREPRTGSATVSLD